MKVGFEDKVIFLFEPKIVFLGKEFCPLFERIHLEISASWAPLLVNHEKSFHSRVDIAISAPIILMAIFSEASGMSNSHLSSIP